MQDQYEMYKIVVIGSSGAGKTNISTKYIRNYFNEVSQTTLGIEFMTKQVQIGNKKIKISLWDTCGQERYKALSKVYYKGASAAIVVYDITDANSYISVESWLRLLNQNVKVEDIVIALVGNKADLQSQRQVPKERPIREFKQTFDMDCWEVSAKTGYNVEQLFADIIHNMVKSNELKSSMFRGTVKYEDSQRGTYINSKIEMANLIQTPVLKNPSVIIEVEEDDKSNAADMKRGLDSINEIPGRLTLKASERKQHKLANQEKKKRKCC